MEEALPKRSGPGNRARTLPDQRLLNRVHCVILATKWKAPRDGQPADDDLKQMYAYNLHFGGHRGVLLYPSAGPHQVPTDQPYAHSLALPAGHRHNCATFYINLFDAENRLRKDIGHDLVKNAILTPA